MVVLQILELAGKLHGEQCGPQC